MLKLLTITIASLILVTFSALFFYLNLKYRSKFHHGYTNHGYLHCAVLKAFYNFEVKGVL